MNRDEFYTSLEENNSLAHAREWKRHKYIRKEGNRYIYKEDGGSSDDRRETARRMGYGYNTNNRDRQLYSKFRGSVNGPGVQKNVVGDAIAQDYAYRTLIKKQDPEHAVSKSVKSASQTAAMNGHKTENEGRYTSEIARLDTAVNRGFNKKDSSVAEGKLREKTNASLSKAKSTMSNAFSSKVQKFAKKTVSSAKSAVNKGLSAVSKLFKRK